MSDERPVFELRMPGGGGIDRARGPASESADAWLAVELPRFQRCTSLPLWSTMLQKRAQVIT